MRQDTAQPRHLRRASRHAKQTLSAIAVNDARIDAFGFFGRKR